LLIFGRHGAIHVLHSLPVFEAAAKKNTDIIFGMVDTEKDP
jgi:hypothetical protein